MGDQRGHEDTIVISDDDDAGEPKKPEDDKVEEVSSSGASNKINLVSSDEDETIDSTTRKGKKRRISSDQDSYSSDDDDDDNDPDFDPGIVSGHMHREEDEGPRFKVVSVETGSAGGELLRQFNFAVAQFTRMVNVGDVGNVDNAQDGASALPSSSSQVPKITNVQVITNKDTELRFNRQKAEIEQQNIPSRETWLFHACDIPGNVEMVLRSNFNLKYVRCSFGEGRKVFYIEYVILNSCFITRF